MWPFRKSYEQRTAERRQEILADWVLNIDHYRRSANPAMAIATILFVWTVGHDLPAVSHNLSEWPAELHKAMDRQVAEWTPFIQKMLDAKASNIAVATGLFDYLDAQTKQHEAFIEMEIAVRTFELGGVLSPRQEHLLAALWEKKTGQKQAFQ